MHIESFASLSDEDCLQPSSLSCVLLAEHITSSVHPGAHEEDPELKGLKGGKIMESKSKEIKKDAFQNTISDQKG